jgi:hypothetical protein
MPMDEPDEGFRVRHNLVAPVNTRRASRPSRTCAVAANREVRQGSGSSTGL